MESFHRAQNWLESLYSEARFFTAKTHPSLESVNKYLDLLGRPDRSFEHRVIVGGTAGKGTVCRRVEQGLLASGKTVLTLVSPHIQVVTERIRVNGKLIDAELFAEGVFVIQDIYEKYKIPLTYYEAIILCGIVIGMSKGIDILVAEIGMGGEWDAVNAVQGPRVAALTFVGADHLEILGPTLADVARTKSGIFTKDTVAGFSYDKNFCSIIQKNSKVEIQFIKGVYSKLNKKIAQKICKYILQKNVEMNPVKIPARFEKIYPGLDFGISSNKTSIILDGAHSKPRFEFLESKYKKIKRPCVGILGMTKNHDPESFELLLPYLDEIIWTSSSQQRVFQDPQTLQEIFNIGRVIPDPKVALSEALKKSPATVLVTGSFYLCGEVRESFYPSDKILKQQTEFPLG